jgi:microcystin-dependent protein
MDLCTPLGFGGLNQIQAPRLSIMPFSGNVGIGTTEPQALLDVSGDMRITGDIINPTGWINPVGSITMYGGSSAPNGWFLCDGGAISRTTYNRLFTVIGTTFGNGDGVSTFNLPNLTNRFPANYGALGATGGSATATLATANLPAHTHTVTSLPTTSNGDHNHTFTVNITESSNSNGDSGNPKWGSGNNNNGTPAYYGTTDNAGSHTHTVSGTTDSTGSGSSFSILPPYISLNFIIKY